jgi:hypothetical protein
MHSGTPRRAVECVSLRSGLCHPALLAVALRPCSLVLRLFGLLIDPEGTRFLRNVCKPLPDYTVSHPSLRFTVATLRASSDEGSCLQAKMDGGGGVRASYKLVALIKGRFSLLSLADTKRN